MKAIKPQEGKIFVRKKDYDRELKKEVVEVLEYETIYYIAQRHSSLYLAVSDNIDNYIETIK